MALSDISAITGYAGKYYQNIIRKIFNDLDIANDVTLLRNVTAPRNLWGFNASKGLRPLDSSVEDTNRSNGSFTRRTISPEIAMKLIKIIPEEYRDTFLSEVLSENAKDLPGEFAAYFWDAQAKTIREEINENAYFGISAKSIATFNPATAYTAGQRAKFATSEGTEYFQAASNTNAGETPVSHPAKWTNINAKCLAKGFGTLIAEEITATNLTNVTSTGPITQADALNQIDGAMWNSIPEEVRAVGVKFLMSQATYDKRVKKLRDLKNSGAGYTEADIDAARTNILDSEGKGVIKPVTWMRGSGRVIWTIDKNMVMGTNQLPGASPFGKFVEGLQHTRGIAKLITCYQIPDLRYLGVNDQA